MRRALCTTLISLESRIEIELPDIETISRTVDFIRTHVPQSYPGVFRQTERRPCVIPGGIRAAFVEVRVRPGIQHCIALHVPIAHGRAPTSECIDDRIAKTGLANVAFVFRRRHCLGGQTLDFVTVVTNVTHSLPGKSERVAAELEVVIR